MPMRSFRDLTRLLETRRALVLSGAGCSTESGIPDYRGPDARPRNHRPVLYQEFVRDERARVRYWARSALGWQRVMNAQPNAGHRALAVLERVGRVSGILTQNVDGLHQRAGSRRIVELHGNLAHVVCLDCGASEGRSELQRRLGRLNPGWTDGGEGGVTGSTVRSAPDGDVELPIGAVEGFRVAGCLGCGGVLKPDVVFFGENVPKARVEEAWSMLSEAQALLVVGSSLTVYSGYRFVVRAALERIPVAIVNLGPTRGDDLASVKLEGKTGSVLAALADALP
ncbi:MAG: NAD-dependent protein deacetylase [Gemmatimonadota bacterium]|nr:MAG: NAD-dependent protein deacetylase [Gemmatimonadota bacterium]